MSKLWRISVVIAAVALLETAQASSYLIYLNGPSGCQGLALQALSRSGIVAMGTYSPQFGSPQIFRYTGGGYTSFGPNQIFQFSGLADDGRASAVGANYWDTDHYVALVNTKGSIPTATGISSQSTYLSGFDYSGGSSPEAFLYQPAYGTPNGAIYYLPHLPNDTRCSADCISGNGNRIGGWGTLTNGARVPVYWNTSDFSIHQVPLPVASSSVISGDLPALSDDGTAGAGWYLDVSGYYWIFRWTESEGPYKIAGPYTSPPTSLFVSNDAGTITGTVKTSKIFPFIWNQWIGYQSLQAYLGEVTSGTPGHALDNAAGMSSNGIYVAGNAHVLSTGQTQGFYAQLDILHPQFGLSLTTNRIVGGNNGTLNASSPTTPATVPLFLTTSNSAAILPKAMFISKGMTTGQLLFPTQGVSADTIATITADLEGRKVTADLTISPAGLGSFALSQYSIQGGSPLSVTGTVQFNGKIGPAGGSLLVRTGNANIVVAPGTLGLAPQTTSKTFSLTTKGAAYSQLVTIAVTYSGVSLSKSLQVNPANLLALVGPFTVLGGQSIQFTIYLDGGAPSPGAVVKLASSNSSVVPIPAEETVAYNQTQLNFSVTSKAVTSDTPVHFTATYRGQQTYSDVTVTHS